MEGGFCGTVCVIGIIIVVIYIIVQIYESVEHHKKIKQAEIERQNAAREEAEKERQSRISSGMNSISTYEADFKSDIKNLSNYGQENYRDSYKRLIAKIEGIKSTIERLKEDDFVVEKDELILKLTKQAEQFKEFGERLGKITFRTVVVANDYGKIDNLYWDEIRNMKSEDADRIINNYQSWMKAGDTDKLANIDPELIPKCVWFYATEKPYSVAKFKNARNLFNDIYKRKFIDFTIAEFYAIKQMGGDDVLRDRIRDMLKSGTYSNEELTTIASGLMWMNAYQEENMVLQHMLAKGQQMTPKTQERLHSLSNGGGKAPAGFDVVSNQQEMYFDVSSLAWKDEEYTGLFESLAFQDKTLSYSLAVRDEDKELFITKGLQVPDMSMILKKISEVFSEEYGDTVEADLRHCIALSGSGEETMDGIIAKAQECKQLGLLVHVARIGKKLNIKFYTLFTPEGTNLMSQKQQALSLFKKLSPSVTMWESSMKDTILMAIQQLLNSEPQAETAPAEDVKGPGEGPIF